MRTSIRAVVPALALGLALAAPVAAGAEPGTGPEGADLPAAAPTTEPGPTPDPATEGDPAASPTPTPTPDPSAAPSTDPGPTSSPEPTPGPEADPGDDPSADPGALDGPFAAALPGPMAPMPAPATIDGYATYDPQVICDPTPKPGTVYLQNLVLAHYLTGRSSGVRLGAQRRQPRREGRRGLLRRVADRRRPRRQGGVQRAPARRPGQGGRRVGGRRVGAVLAQGYSRETVALGFLLSTERLTTVVDGYLTGAARRSSGVIGPRRPSAR